MSFIHIPREWNRVANWLPKWASEHGGDWKVEGWGNLSLDCRQDIERILVEDIDGYDVG